MVSLEELYISHNGIEEIEGLDNLVSEIIFLEIFNDAIIIPQACIGHVIIDSQQGM